MWKPIRQCEKYWHKQMLELNIIVFNVKQVLKNYFNYV